MDLYTLNENFLAREIIDEFVSAIWTERFTTAGDTQLVVPATQANIDKLAPGVYLALRGTREVMILETQDIENKLLTVTGKTLITMLNQRFAWFKSPTSTDSLVTDYSEESVKASVFLHSVVDQMVINPVPFTGAFIGANLDWTMEAIPYLSLGAMETLGVLERRTIATGPLYDGIQQVAEQGNMGISLYLESADPIIGYSLKFTTYGGHDRTSTQIIRPMVRLVPEMDQISGIKEIHSISQYKNVCYVYYKNQISKHLAEPTLPEPEGLARRTLIVDAEGQPVGHPVTVIGQWGRPYTQTVIDIADENDFRDQNARNAFANHNYIRAIDGQTSPQNDYKYGVDYGLGDIIELEGLTGTITKARVTEYIRSQDQTGEKEYPTISVVE